MEHSEFQKEKSFNIADSIDYVPMSVVIKTIHKKNTGSISISSFDSGETLSTRPIPFDVFIQIIDGIAEVEIDQKTNQIKSGQAIIIPAHSSNTIKANERFKMLSTIIKSGYEEVS